MSRTQKLLDILVQVGALKNGKFTSKLVTLNPEGLKLLSLAFLYHIRKIGAEAIGGPTLGAGHLVRALCHQSNYDAKPPIPAFTVCEERIEGKLKKGIPVAIVNDTDASLLEAITDVEGLGHEVVLVIVLLDLCKGGREKLREVGHKLVSIFEVTPEGEIVPTEQKAR